jgi:hypothetical protein
MDAELVLAYLALTKSMNGLENLSITPKGCVVAQKAGTKQAKSQIKRSQCP